jgi:anti-anti-sigma factor
MLNSRFSRPDERSGLRIGVQHEPEQCVVHLEGELDMLSAPSLLVALDSVLRERDRCTRIVLDASALRFVDSVGIGMLVRTWRTSTDCGCTFDIANPTANVRRLLDITGLTTLLASSPDMSQASF